RVLRGEQRGTGHREAAKDFAVALLRVDHLRAAVDMLVDGNVALLPEFEAGPPLLDQGARLLEGKVLRYVHRCRCQTNREIQRLEGHKMWSKKASWKCQSRPAYSLQHA